ncbi:MAG: DUF4157 domain-containing protein [Comamonadaceae bacterium]|nr:DUF4157 domain-containing protein [Comamonadaceae bacterium]
MGGLVAALSGRQRHGAQGTPAQAPAAGRRHSLRRRRTAAALAPDRDARSRRSRSASSVPPIPPAPPTRLPCRRISRSRTTPSGPRASWPSSACAVVPGLGEPLPAATRRRFEAQLGRNLGAVRVHRGPAAEHAAGELQAQAFTYRNHIFLGPRADPGDTRLLAHELTHVAQQGHAPALAHRGAIALTGRAAANSPVYAPAARARTSASRRRRGVRRWRLDIFGAACAAPAAAVASGVRAAVGRGIADVAGDLLGRWGATALLAVVRRVAPELRCRCSRATASAGFAARPGRGADLRALFGGRASGRLQRHPQLRQHRRASPQSRQATFVTGTIADDSPHNDCMRHHPGAPSAARELHVAHASQPITSRIREHCGCSFRISSAMHLECRSARRSWRFLRAHRRRHLGRASAASSASVGRVITPRARRARQGLAAACKSWFGIACRGGRPAEGGGLWNWIRDKARGTVGGRIKRTRCGRSSGPLRDSRRGAARAGRRAGLIAAGHSLPWPRLQPGVPAGSAAALDAILNLVRARAGAFLANTVLPAVDDDAAEALAEVVAACRRLAPRPAGAHRRWRSPAP